LKEGGEGRLYERPRKESCDHNTLRKESPLLYDEEIVSNAGGVWDTRGKKRSPSGKNLSRKGNI